MRTTAAATAKALSDAGIHHVFGLPGGEVLTLIDELRKWGVDFVLMRHEANAGLAAAVYGKIKRQPGVVLATLGPGAANLMLPIASAHLDREPLLAITAQLPDDAPPTHTHQLLPLIETYRPIVKMAGKINNDNVYEMVTRALTECMKAPHGPCYLTLSAKEALVPFHDVGTQKMQRFKDHDHGDARAMAEALTQKLAASERPIVLVGIGIDSKHAQALRGWLDAWNLPVAVTPKAKGIVDESSANFVGVISGMAADGLMVEALQAADLRIGLGLDPVEVDKTWHAELPIHWLLESPNVGGIIPEATELVEHGPLLTALAHGKPPRPWDRPFASFQQKRLEMLNGTSAGAHTMWPGDLIRALASVVPPSAIVTTDVGSHKYLFGQFWPSREPDTFWMSNGLSGMAYGLSAAIGAKLARPTTPVIAAVGDGGFSMNAQELETAQRIGAPFVTIVLEDGSYSLIKLSQENKKLKPYRMDFGPIDTVKTAEACGVEAIRTANPDELAAAVKNAIEKKRALVVGVPIDYTDYRKLF